MLLKFARERRPVMVEDKAYNRGKEVMGILEVSRLPGKVLENMTVYLKSKTYV